jgi:hypothetical protein
VIRAVIALTGTVTYLAQYDMNRATAEQRAAFLAKVEKAMLRF